jgi:hypothetical protein
LGVCAIMSLGKVHYDPKHAAGFGSLPQLVQAGKRHKICVEEWLSGQDTYTLNKPVRKMLLENLLRLQVLIYEKWNLQN